MILHLVPQKAQGGARKGIVIIMEKYIEITQSTAKASRGKITGYKVNINYKGKHYTKRFKLDQFSSQRECFLAAINERNRILSELGKGNLDVKPVQAETVEEIFNRIKLNYTRSKTTFQRYNKMYNKYIAPVCAQVPLIKVKAMNIEMSLYECAKQCTQESVTHLKSLWSLIYSCAIKTGVQGINMDLTKVVDTPQSNNFTERSQTENNITQKDFENFLAFAKDYGKYDLLNNYELQYNKMIMLYALQLQRITGLRSQEVRALTEEDITFTQSNKAVIHVRHSLGATYEEDLTLRRLKTRQSRRDLTLPEKYTNLIKEMLAYRVNAGKANPDNLIFADYCGHAISSNRYSDFIRRVSRKYEKETGIHLEIYSTLMRKSCITDLKDSGCSLFEVQSIAGHQQSSATTFNFYYQNSAENNEAILEKRKFKE